MRGVEAEREDRKWQVGGGGGKVEGVRAPRRRWTTKLPSQATKMNIKTGADRRRSVRGAEAEREDRKWQVGGGGGKVEGVRAPRRRWTTKLPSQATKMNIKTGVDRRRSVRGVKGKSKDGN